MNIRNSIQAVLVSLCLCGPAFAAEISGDDPVICALMEVHECVAGIGCERVLPHEVNLHTRFVSVDFKKREIRAKDTDRKTTADRLFEVGDKFVLAGAETGEWVAEQGIGYSLTITRDNGNMVLSASGDDVSFVVFGNCTLR